MSSREDLPSLFGRFTTIFQAHERLGQTMRKLRAMCAGLAAGDERPAELEPRTLLAELRTDLAEHFAAEEAREYFGVVADEAPVLATQIDGLKLRHRVMLQAADGLVNLAHLRDRWPSLVAPVRALVARLERHERDESRLLRDLFFTDH